ncbi:MAG: MaoC family dehydratase [Brachymonas sp.]
MASFETTADLAACVGQEIAVSEWTQITQAQVQKFAEATGDFQWIHVNPERAKAGPFGAPIAHGFLTLSLIPKFFDETIEVREPSMGVNYGLNKVRFMMPVPVGSRVRGRMKLASCEPVDGPGGIVGVQMAWSVTVEIEGVAKPACVAELLGRRYPQVP